MGKSSQYVQYALVDTLTESLSAQLTRHGTKSSKPLPSERTSCSFPRRASAYAPNGNNQVPAKMIMPAAICAPGMVPPYTELHSALMHRESTLLTPYKAHTWETLLHAAGLLPCFAKIPPGLHRGFNLNFPSIHCCQSPPNKQSIVIYSQEFNEYVSNKISKSRYLGPFSLSSIQLALSPFQLSPLSIIPKPDRPGKFRLIQNFSFPLNPSPSYPNLSINSLINAEDFPTTWGKFSLVFALISQLPPGSEAATHDIAEAYCTIPLHPSQWPAAVIKISDSLGYIDTCTAFRATPAVGAYGLMADAGCELMRHAGIGPMEKWVDNHVFFHIC
ncbi:hypothetical protein ID866_12072 [Astraeus odoratus]|nr:hypothetical protein ID866_12072 [Astraeus odoratus]